MANTKISALTSLGAVPATNDQLVIVDVSDTTHAASGTTKKIAASFFAFQAQVNTFTVSQIIQPSATNAELLVLNAPSGMSATTQEWRLNSSRRIYVNISATASQIGFDGTDMGALIGPTVILGRNNNGSTPAAGNIRMTDKGATEYYVWPDDSGNLRIGTTAPTNAQDTSGTVVGTQTSMAEAKHISDELSVLGEVMERIRAGAAAVRRFTYKNEAFNRQEFEGVVTDLAPAYGMDRDADHPQGKSLNEIQILGDLLRAVDWLMNELETTHGHN